MEPRVCGVNTAGWGSLSSAGASAPAAGGLQRPVWRERGLAQRGGGVLRQNGGENAKHTPLKCSGRLLISISAIFLPRYSLGR